MKLTLVFMPCASPTYKPLGLASLSSYLKKNHPDFKVKAIDLNIALWNRIIDQENRYQPFRDFIQGNGGNFYDEDIYRNHLITWNQLSEIQDSYIQMACGYLEQGILNPQLGKLFDFQSEIIIANDPELIGFSIMYPKQILLTLAMSKFLRSGKQLKSKIIIGGAMMSALYAEEILNACPFIDAIFEGEGEAALGMLCAGQDFSDIPGLVYRRKETILRNSKADTISLNEVPLPDFDELDFSMYFNPQPVVPVIFSRGCKWRKCRFCTHNFSYAGYRKRNVNEFVDYLSKLNQLKGIRHFYFADQYVDALDMKMMADRIIELGLKINFQIMGRPTSDYTLQILQTLYNAGCSWISWGVESGSQRLLDMCNKGTSVETIRKVIKDSHQAGISNLLMMIFGLPTSTDDDFDATMDLLDDLEGFVDAVTSSSFQLFDKTVFAMNAEKFGLKIKGRQKLFSINQNAVYSNRLFYHEKGDCQSEQLPRGPVEIARLDRRKLWTKKPSIFQTLCCEHYLLYSSHSKQIKYQK